MTERIEESKIKTGDEINFFSVKSSSKKPTSGTVLDFFHCTTPNLLKAYGYHYLVICDSKTRHEVHESEIIGSYKNTSEFDVFLRELIDKKKAKRKSKILINAGY